MLLLEEGIGPSSIVVSWGGFFVVYSCWENIWSLVGFFLMCVGFFPIGLLWWCFVVVVFFFSPV